MKCPRCGAWSSVVETREAPHQTTKRKRECANHHRFITFEVHPVVIRTAHRDLVAAARTILARIKQWHRNRKICADSRLSAEVAKDYGLTPTRVSQIRKHHA